jgi:hypothetical protein
MSAPAIQNIPAVGFPAQVAPQASTFSFSSIQQQQQQQTSVHAIQQLQQTPAVPPPVFGQQAPTAPANVTPSSSAHFGAANTQAAAAGFGGAPLNGFGAALTAPTAQRSQLEPPPAVSVAKTQAATSPEPVPDEPPEKSDAVPDADDTPFSDLLDFVISKVHNPNDEDGTDAYSAYSIRSDTVLEKVLGNSKLADWSNAQVRGDKEAFEEHIASKLNEEERKMLSDILFKQKPSPAGPPAREKVQRVFGRPKAHSNFMYGGISVQFRNTGEAVPQPLGSWEDMVRYQEDRFRAFSDQGSRGADLVDMNAIIMAINRFVGCLCHVLLCAECCF